MTQQRFALVKDGASDKKLDLMLPTTSHWACADAILASRAIVAKKNVREVDLKGLLATVMGRATNSSMDLFGVNVMMNGLV